MGRPLTTDRVGGGQGGLSRVGGGVRGGAVPAAKKKATGAQEWRGWPETCEWRPPRTGRQEQGKGHGRQGRLDDYGSRVGGLGARLRRNLAHQQKLAERAEQAAREQTSAACAGPREGGESSGAPKPPAAVVDVRPSEAAIDGEAAGQAAAVEIRRSEAAIEGDAAGQHQQAEETVGG